MSGLAVVYETTDDTPDGIPWPPIDDFYWCAIKQERGRTRWRRVALLPAAVGNVREGGFEAFVRRNRPSLPSPPWGSDDP